MAKKAGRTSSASRRMPQRAAKSRGSTAENGPAATDTVRRTSGRVTRSSAQADFIGDEDSDEDSSEFDALNAPSTRSTRKRTLSQAQHDGPGSTRRAKRTRHRTGFYDEDDEADELVQDVQRLSTTDGTATKRTSTRSQQKKPSTNPSPRKARAKPHPVKHEVQLPVHDSDAVIPPWTELPYLILVQIFEYASYPLDDLTTTRWLVSASLTCKTFCEPALTAMYKCPPVFASSMAHNLVELLALPPDALHFGYRQKIEKLSLDVEQVATHSYRGTHLDLGKLVQNLPRLQEVDLYHRMDMRPYRNLDDNIKWHYPPELFTGLGIPNVYEIIGFRRRSPTPGDVRSSADMNSGSLVQRPPTKLKGWSWSSRMMRRNVKSLAQLHSTPTFSDLRRLSFVNYQLPSLHHRNPDDPEVLEADRKYLKYMTNSISVLHSLKFLALESSTVVTKNFLLALPDTIEHLALVNCWEVTAPDLSEYLLSRGGQMRHLTLHHNQSLSLGFLPVLADACPHLRSLRMDLTYFKHHEYYEDSDPNYVSLLEEGEVPQWPSDLEVLELENLRKWGPEAAECLFQSLTDSAERLPMLRRIFIKAMLDIPWRERSGLREKWQAKFEKIFLRKWRPPLPRFSLREAPPAVTIHEQADEPKLVSRSVAASANESSSSSRASSADRELRKSRGGRVSYAEPDTDDDMGLDDDDGKDEHEASSSAEESNGGPASPASSSEPFIQGLCEVVDIIFDNQKLREQQFNMDDFLDDSDGDSDGDWNGDVGDMDGGGYAW